MIQLFLKPVSSKHWLYFQLSFSVLFCLHKDWNSLVSWSIKTFLGSLQSTICETLLLKHHKVIMILVLYGYSCKKTFCFRRKYIENVNNPVSSGLAPAEETEEHLDLEAAFPRTAEDLLAMKLGEYCVLIQQLFHSYQTHFLSPLRYHSKT